MLDPELRTKMRRVCDAFNSMEDSPERRRLGEECIAAINECLDDIDDSPGGVPGGEPSFTWNHQTIKALEGEAQEQRRQLFELKAKVEKTLKGIV